MWFPYYHNDCVISKNLFLPRLGKSQNLYLVFRTHVSGSNTCTDALVTTQ